MRYVQFEVRVLDAATGEPVEQCTVVADRPESRQRRKHLPRDSRTKYRRGTVDPGRHTVTVDALDHEDAEFEVDVQPDAKGGFSHTIRLTRMSEPTVQIHLTVEVTDANSGVRIETVKIEIQDKDTREPLTRFQGKREGGLFFMPGLSGTRLLVVTAAGYEPYVQEHTFEASSGEAEVKVPLRLK